LAEFQKLEQLTSLSITSINIKGNIIPEDFQPDDLESIFKSGKIIKTNNNKYLTGYLLVRDITGDPGIIFKIEIPRKFFQEAQSSIRYFLIVITGILLFFGFTAIFSAEKEGLYRLKLLADTVENIAASGKTTGRLSVKGKDEISSLAIHINHMLASLQQSEKALKEKAEYLQTAVIEAQIANQAKTEFLSGVSHELRTPLTAIIGLGQLLQKRYYGNLNSKQSEYVNDILDSSSHLLSLINDILDLAKIEAGKSSLELTESRIRDLMESSLLLVKESANKKGLFLNLNIPDEILDQKIIVDKRRFRQIMINLLSNAIKFTNSGSVTISADLQTDYLEIIVSDTGIGITSEEQQKIFNAFYQVYSGTTGKSPGTGLGLSLAKRFVEQHQGKLWVASEGLGKGSRFHFTIFLRLADKQTAFD
jgi:signal transduction histidine kinase